MFLFYFILIFLYLWYRELFLYTFLQDPLLPADGSDGPRGKDAGRDSVWTPGSHSVYERLKTVIFVLFLTTFLQMSFKRFILSFHVTDI